MRQALGLLVLVGVVACGAPPDPEVDAGSPLDSGTPGDAGCIGTTVETKLRCIGGLDFTTALDAGFPGYTRYDLTFEQPVDHARPDAGTFSQRLFLLATDATRPMVLATSGYHLSTRRNELTRVYAANQLSYEFRYFGRSKPAGAVDWSTDTVRQAADDAHRIVEAFKPLFPAKWVGTGTSKGGMSSVYHRRFHPDDVDATVAMVTPHNVSAADPAYSAFLASVGGSTWAGCRQALVNFQRACLTRTAELQPLLVGFFTRLTRPIAVEHAVIETGFSFWQYTRPADPTFGCSRVPAMNSPAQDLVDFLDVHGSWANFTDPGIADYDSFYVSSPLELGSPSPYDAPLAPLISQPGRYTFLDPRYQPPGFVGVYSAVTQADVTQWVSTEAERMLFVHGEFDPWSAGAYLPSGRDTLVLTVPGGNHGARLVDLPATEQSLAWSTLDRWLNAVAVPSARALLPKEDELPEPRPPM